MRRSAFSIIALLMLGMVVMVVASMVGSEPLTEVEPNDDSTQATEVPRNDVYTYVEYRGNVNTRTDPQDWYKVTVGSSEIIVLEFGSGGRTSSSCELISGPSQERVRSLSSSDWNYEAREYLHSYETTDTWYYIKVTTMSTIGTGYQINVTVNRQDDMELGRDARGEIAGAEEIEPSHLYRGRLGDLDARDCYKIYAGRGEGIQGWVESTSIAVLQYQLYNSNLEVVNAQQLETGEDGRIDYLTCNETPRQWWTLEVTVDGRRGEYEFGLFSWMQYESENGDKDASGVPGIGDTMRKISRDPEIRRYRQNNGILKDLDTMDIFTIQAGRGDIIYLNLFTTSREFLNVSLMSDHGTLAWAHVKDDTIEIVHILPKECRTSPFFIAISHTSVEVPLAFYWLHVKIEVQDDADVGQDAPCRHDQAIQLTDGLVKGVVGDGDRVDFYSIELAGGAFLSVTFQADREDKESIELHLKSHLNESVAQITAKRYWGDGELAYSAPPLASGTWTYFFEVVDRSQPEVELLDQMDLIEEYQYSIQWSVDGHNDSGTGQDVANERLGALPIPDEDIYFMGYLTDTDTSDWYKFILGEGENLNLYCYAFPEDQARFRVVDPTGNVVYEVTRTLGRSIVTALETPSEWWYLHILHVGSETIQYNYMLNISRQSSAFGPDVPGSYEVGFTEGATAQLDGPGRYGDDLGDLDRLDIYSFMAGEGDTIDIAFEVETQDELSLTLLSKDGTIWGKIVPDRVDYLHASGKLSLLTAYETVVQEWFIVIELENDIYTSTYLNSDGWAYYFSLRLLSQYQDETWAGDVPGTYDMALTTKSAEGPVGDLDTVDMYRFTAGSSEVINVTFNLITQTAISLGLHDHEEDSIWEVSEPGVHQVSVPLSYEYPVQDFYIVVEGTGRYWFFISTPEQDDAASSQDAPNSFESYVQPPLGTLAHGQLGMLDKGDVLLVPVIQDLEVRMNVTTRSDHGLSVSLFDSEGTLIEASDEASVYEIVFDHLVTGESGANTPWFVRIEPLQGSTVTDIAYDITVILGTSVTPDSPDIQHDGPTSASADEDLVITVTVEDEDEVVSVTLYYKMKDETDWETVEMVSDGDDWTGTIPHEDIKEGGTLQYYIVAEDEAGNQQYHGSINQPIEMDTGPVVSEGFSTATLLMMLVLGLIIGVLVGYIFAARSAH